MVADKDDNDQGRLLIAATNTDHANALNKSIQACRLENILSSCLPEDSFSPATTFHNNFIGLMVCWSTDEFFELFTRLSRKGCYRIIVATMLDGEPWCALRSEQQAAFRERCTLCSPVSISHIINVIETLCNDIPKPAGFDFLGNICDHIVAARECYDILKKFTHGGIHDISNGLLAPLRMICLASPEERNAVLWAREPLQKMLEFLLEHNFTSSVVSKIKEITP